MIDLTLSSDDGSPAERRHVSLQLPQAESQLPWSANNDALCAFRLLAGNAVLGAKAGLPPRGPPGKGLGADDPPQEATTNLFESVLEGISELFPLDFKDDSEDVNAGGDGELNTTTGFYIHTEVGCGGAGADNTGCGSAGADVAGYGDAGADNAGCRSAGAYNGGIGHGRRRKIQDEPGGSDSDRAIEAESRKKKRGGSGKRPMEGERQERALAKNAEKEAKAAERQRQKMQKDAQKAAEILHKNEQKRARAAQKEAVREQKVIDQALKVTMVGRYMRLLLSNTLAASPLGWSIVDQIPVVRGNKEGETFPHEVHRDMPLAAQGYKYCMWGVRLPAAAAARLQASEGCSLEPSELPDPSGKNLPMMLFPAVLVILTGDELLMRLENQPGAPLAVLYGDVVRAHPGASLLVYVIGLAEAMKRRERANRSFSRMAIEDLLFDMAVGMPAVRLQYDCRENDLGRAAVDILNMGWTLSQQPRKKMEAYLGTFGSKNTLPLRAIKEVLLQQGGQEQLTLCEALSQLVAPQRAAAVAAEFPSLAAIIEALRSRTERRVRESLLANCLIPGVVPTKGKQQVAGPAAAASLVRFLLTQNGREEWKWILETEKDA